MSILLHLVRGALIMVLTELMMIYIKHGLRSWALTKS